VRSGEGRNEGRICLGDGGGAGVAFYWVPSGATIVLLRTLRSTVRCAMSHVHGGLFVGTSSGNMCAAFVPAKAGEP
jgi:hypothetical protein